MSNTDVSRVDAIISQIKNHKIAALLIVICIGLGAAATLIKSLSEAIVTGFTLVEPEIRPNWLVELTRQPLRPGIGMAGLSIGQSEKELITSLGEPTKNIGQVIGNGYEIFLDNRPGVVQHYALIYEYGSVRLGIYTDRDTRRIRSFRLSCHGGGSECKELPSFHGVAVGTSASSLKVLGEPIRRIEHVGCASPEMNATWYQFQGIAVSVCRQSFLVEMIDLQ
jgi:hypothetical protein